MSLLEIWLLAVGLAMDCFTVSVTSGIILKRVRWNTLLTMGLLFGLFQAFMPVIGWYGACICYHQIQAYDHWIAFGLLLILGLRMMKAHFSSQDSYSFDPTRLKIILALAIATSIDAMTAGISLAFTGFHHFRQLMIPISIIGTVSFLLSVTGSLTGIFFGKRFHLKMELFGGMILIAIGCKILIEHLYFNH